MRHWSRYGVNGALEITLMNYELWKEEYYHHANWLLQLYYSIFPYAIKTNRARVEYNVYYFILHWHCLKEIIWFPFYSPIHTFPIVLFVSHLFPPEINPQTTLAWRSQINPAIMLVLSCGLVFHWNPRRQSHANAADHARLEGFLWWYVSDSASDRHHCQRLPASATWPMTTSSHASTTIPRTYYLRPLLPPTRDDTIICANVSTIYNFLQKFQHSVITASSIISHGNPTWQLPPSQFLITDAVFFFKFSQIFTNFDRNVATLDNNASMKSYFH